MLGTRIKELRKEFGLSQVELATRMEVTKQTISNWENENIQPSIDMLVGLANVFNVTTDYLLGLDDVPRLSIEGLPLSFAAHLAQIIEDFRQLE
ncbi:MAG: helix-turn-helix transcriptional regulator [Ruminiclostridium sp.]|nr:helix-turn-helix transcriptional regulator [Ruminiclostridium sp.]